MCEEIKELHADDFFKPGEQVYIHIDNGDSGYHGVMHRHNFIEIVYVLSGSARHYIGDLNYEVKKGSLIIINYGVPHTFITTNELGENFSTYDLLFTTELFEVTGIGSYDFASLASSYLFYSLFTDNNAPENALNLIKTNSGDFLEIFKKIYNEYHTRGKGFMNIIRAHLIELITKIFREIDASTSSNVTREQRETISKAINYMKQNYNTHINLESIAADIFFSKNYFRQLFKSTTGISITDFIQKTRIEEASRLLVSTDRTIYDIAGSCGFGDVKFFYKTFKKITGQTPNEFRKEKKLTEMIL